MSKFERVVTYYLIAMIVALVLLASFIAAASAQTVTPSPTPNPTITPKPTVTSLPVVTPMPSVTPFVTITPGPAITQTLYFTEAFMDLGASRVVTCTGLNDASLCQIDGSIIQYISINDSSYYSPASPGISDTHFFLVDIVTSFDCNNSEDWTKEGVDEVSWEDVSGAWDDTGRVDGMIILCVPKDTSDFTLNFHSYHETAALQPDGYLEVYCNWGGCGSYYVLEEETNYKSYDCESSYAHDNFITYTVGGSGIAVGYAEFVMHGYTFNAGACMGYPRDTYLYMEIPTVISHEQSIPLMSFYPVTEDTINLNCSELAALYPEGTECLGEQHLTWEYGYNGLKFCAMASGMIRHQAIFDSEDYYVNNGFHNTIIFDPEFVGQVTISHTEYSVYYPGEVPFYSILPGEVPTVTEPLSSIEWDFCTGTDLPDSFYVDDGCSTAGYVGHEAVAYGGESFVPVSIPEFVWSSTASAYIWPSGGITLAYSTFEGEHKPYTLYPDWSCYDAEGKKRPPDGGGENDFGDLIDIEDGVPVCVYIPVSEFVSVLSSIMEFLSLEIDVPDSDSLDVCMFTRTVTVKYPLQVLNSFGLIVSWIIVGGIGIAMFKGL